MTTIAHDDPVRKAFRACVGSYKMRGKGVRVFDNVLALHGFGLDWANAYDFAPFYGRRVFLVRTGQGECAGRAVFTWEKERSGGYSIDGYLL